MDMYAASSDPDLASLSGTTKQLTMCPEYGAPKDMFHWATRQTYCQQALIDKQIPRDQCIEARTYCQKMM